MNDRRRAKRIPAILEGRITWEGHAPYIPCTIRNLSETGAQIWLPGAIDLPREFELGIPKLEQSLEARLMWSKAQSHGVMFLTPLQSHVGEDVTGLLEALKGSEAVPAPEPAPQEDARPSARPAPESPSLWRRILGRILGPGS